MSAVLTRMKLFMVYFHIQFRFQGSSSFGEAFELCMIMQNTQLRIAIGPTYQRIKRFFYAHLCIFKKYSDTKLTLI